MADDGDVKLKVTADGSGAEKEFKKVALSADFLAKKAARAGKRIDNSAKKGAKSLKDKLGKAVKDIMGKFEKMAMPLMGVKAAIDMVTAAWGKVTGAVAAVVAAWDEAKNKALEVRGAADSMVQAFEKSGEAAGTLLTTVGDMGIASDTAFNKVMAPSLKEINGLLDESGGYIADSTTQIKAVAMLIGGVLLGAVSTVINALATGFMMVQNVFTAAANLVMAGLSKLGSWILKVLPGNWDDAISAMEDSTAIFADSAKDDLGDIVEGSKFAANMHKATGTAVVGLLEVSSAAGKTAKEIFNARQKVEALSEATRGKAFAAFGKNIRKGLDEGLEGFAKVGESLEQTQRRMDGLREGVANLKEGFESSKIEFLTPAEIAESTQALKAVLSEAGIDIPIDIDTLHAKDQAEALVQVYTAAEQKLGHTSANIGRLLADNIAKETEIAAKKAAKALEVDLAEKAFEKVKGEAEKLRESLEDAFTDIAESNAQTAQEVQAGWIDAGQGIAENMGEVFGTMVSDAESVEDALKAFAENTLLAIVDAIMNEMAAEESGEARKAELHQLVLTRLDEQIAKETELAAVRASLSQAKLGQDTAEGVSAQTTAGVEMAAGAQATAAKVTGESTQTAVTETSTLANMGKAATGAASALASIPIIGPALGAAAAMGIMMLLKGLISGLFKAEGGFLTGGTAGRDSIPMVGMPGEYVMSVPEVAGARKFLGAMGSPAPSPAAPAAAQAAPQIKVVFSSTIPATRTQAKELMRRDILPLMRELRVGGF